MIKYLNNLNHEQLTAVRHGSGPCMVLAGPGTGKTTVITSRVCSLIDQKLVSPDKILVVTFSKAAAEEMKYRFKKLAENCRAGDCRLDGFGNVSFGTFHSIFFKLLRQYEGYKLENLIDETERFNVIRGIVRKLELDYFEDEDQIAELLNDIGYYMNTMSDIREFKPSSCQTSIFSEILERYISYKTKYSKYDYDDMLVDCYYLLANNPQALREIRNKYSYILVDEFQDINKVQYNTICMIAEPNNNIFVVGDDDQSIYGFRGADPKIMQDFEKEHRDCIKILLKNNYRTTDTILKLSAAVIKNNTTRYEKILQAMKAGGTAPVLAQPEDSESEANAITSLIRKKQEQGYNYSEIAIIYRTNIQARAIIDAFWDGNIPFVAAEGAASIYSHWIFKDISAYLRLALGIGDNNDLLRIINKPKRFISRAAIDKAGGLNGSLINNLIMHCGLNNLQVRALDELKVNLQRLKSMSTDKAIKYIRTVIGYDEYISEYSSQKGINPAGLFEVLNEVEGSSVGFPAIAMFLAHLEEILINLREKPKDNIRENKVRLMTMHRSKGLEFPLVIICGATEGLSPYMRETAVDEQQLEEERRLFYVAMTRAKHELYIYSPKTRYKKKAQKSRFIEEMYSFDPSEIDIKPGQRLYHKIYQSGVISSIREVKGSIRISVDFGGVLKELDIAACIKNELIQLL